MKRSSPDVEPDRRICLPDSTFEFSSAAAAGAETLLTGPPQALVHALLDDHESEFVLLAARRILSALLDDSLGEHSELGLDAVVEMVATLRRELDAKIVGISGGNSSARVVTLLERAPLALLAGCWLDTVSQPATQPALIVNRLLEDCVRLRGGGHPRKALTHLRRTALESQGVHLPVLGAEDFISASQAHPLTVRQAIFYLALSRFPATFLPEVVGVHYAVFSLGVDDRLLRMPPALSEASLRAVLAEYFTLADASVDGARVRQRLAAAVGLVLRLEREQVDLLSELATRNVDQSPHSEVTEIVRRHLPFAGEHHRDVVVGGRSLADVAASDDAEVAELIRELHASPYVRSPTHSGPRIVRAIKFGGPMFGIFDEAEAAALTAWAREPDVAAADSAAQVLYGYEVSPNHAISIGDAMPADVVWADRAPDHDRQLFHRLVNVENFPNIRPVARERAAQVLQAAEVLFEHGSSGRYTDASFFPYESGALRERIERIYFDKRLRRSEATTELPSRGAVVSSRKERLITNMVDGCWLYRIGATGRYGRDSDGQLFAIYADEMGGGDIRKNHIMLIHGALADMRISVPHISNVDFLSQCELPDSSYAPAIYQICLALFPDSYYPEILGYNLGMEMGGIGELGISEIRRLRHYGFDATYEATHLSIDNISSGHSRQAADIIVRYLDDVRRESGDAAVAARWRRVWRGYASFAYFAERDLVQDL
ncbi:hypothetical protein Franean1_2818 [Parafrankia sp. EAN1pec]|uniref:iron-containing redox enzyme family protein n=1 Tax=Parafrankia sp. (strain EAN1pec) TaxID=298653 RepID=UPI0000540E57|nr:hypothetical protein Franean1_2818 [Frankia sp. EAN1pec]